MKKLLLLIFSITILFSFVGCKDKTDENIWDSYKGVKYEVSKTGTYAKVTGFWGGMDEIIIADTYENLPVTEICDRAFYNEDKNSRLNDVTSITIPDSVTKIGNYAFYNCNKVESITIGKGVNEVGMEAFTNCTSIKDVYITDLAAWCNIEFSSFPRITNPAAFADNLYLNGELITDLIIPDGVTEIRSHVFYNCKNIQSVHIPDSVTSIGGSAFARCNNLTSVTIPDSVTTIGTEAFKGCTALTSLTLGSNLTSIGSGAFRECKLLTTVTIPDSVKVIDSSAFLKCYNLESIIIGSSVSSIGDYAFRHCSKVTSIVIPDSVSSIGKLAFGDCKSLTDISIGSGLTTIGEGAFDGCEALTDVHAKDLTSWCNISFGDASANPAYVSRNLYIAGEPVTDVVIPDEITSIGAFAFCGYNTLNSVVISDNVTEISKEAFASCPSLTNVIIGDGVKTIAERAFASCTSLTDVVIGNGVTTIAEGVFADCEALASVTLGTSIESIGENAFLECTALNAVYISDIGNWCNISFFDYYSNPLYYAKRLYLNGEFLTDLVVPERITYISDYAFYDYTSLLSITFPNGVVDVGAHTFYACECTVYTKYEYGKYKGDENNPHHTLYEITDKTLTAYNVHCDTFVIADGVFKDCENLTEIILPQNVTAIGNETFYNCSSLVNIDIPNDVAEIGDYAFYNCASLSEIRIPYCLYSVGEKAFFGCASLGAVHISDMYSWCGISFPDCYSNPLYFAKKLYINGEQVTEVIVPDGISSISSYAFYNCEDLTYVSIPYSVTAIGEDAFCNCSLITSVHTNDVGAWSSISFGSLYANPLVYAGKLYLYGELVTDVVIPNGVTEIGDYAFYNCESLTAITIPETVTSIGVEAFSYCSKLTYVSVSDIGAWCNVSFADCNANPVYFAEKLYLNGELLTDLVIPEGVTFISEYAFYCCSSITTVTIPESVTEIGDYAFLYCYGINNVYYLGTSEGWQSISVNDSFNYHLTDANVQFSS